MNRIRKIITVVSRSFSTSLFSFLISFVGIYSYGKTIWGEFIQLFTWILLIAFLTSFGNKDYLLRKYSNKPSKIALYYSNNVVSRMLLLIISIVLFFFFPFHIAIASVILIVLIFIYQSFESLIIYHQKFLKQLIAESIGFLLIITYFLVNKTYNLEMLIYVFSASFFVKISFLIIDFKKYFIVKNIHFSLDELKKSFSFFLIIFSGFIASKIDLYIVNVIMPKESISVYQIGITAFLLLQSVSYLLILPFNKHLYRLKLQSIKKIKKTLYLVALPIVVIGSFMIWFIFERIINLNLPICFYYIGGISSIPTYFFIVDIIQHYRNKEEKIILKINLIAAFINLTLSIILINKLAIIGALMSVLITQIVLVILYKTKWIK